MLRGIRAAELLSNTDMMGFIDEWKHTLLDALSNTDPHEVKTRESLYYQHRAIKDLMATLDQYVGAAKQIISADEAAQRDASADPATTQDID